MIQSVASLIAFTVTETITEDVLRAALAGYPGMIAGLLVGERMAARIDRRSFRVLVIAMLVLAASASIARAIW